MRSIEEKKREKNTIKINKDCQQYWATKVASFVSNDSLALEKPNYLFRRVSHKNSKLLTFISTSKIAVLVHLDGTSCLYPHGRITISNCVTCRLLSFTVKPDN